ncbi:MAG: hypothetical protein WC222_00840 [Parachlamydiales bacterium]|jgi:hypothetical protein
MKVHYYIIFLALFTFNLNAQGYTVEKQGNITSINNNADVVSYTGKKNDPNYVVSLKTKYNGLKDTAKIDQLLKQQNYIEVLNHLWTEPDANKRRQWLEARVNQGHPILMFELGEEYYAQNPTIQTFVLKTMPWLMSGTRRTLIDAACTSDQSVMAAPELLLVTYRDRVLNDLLVKNSQEDLQKFITENSKEFQKNNIAILKQVLTPLVGPNADSLPSASWVYPHGLAAFTGSKNTIPATQCTELRKKEAQQFLDQISKMEETLKN